MRQIIFILGLTGILAACGSVSDTAGSELAYDQGCRAGLLTGGRGNDYVPHRDEQLYAADDLYRQSWDKGFGECFDRSVSEPMRH